MAGVTRYLTILCYFLIYIRKTAGEEGILKSGTMNVWFFNTVDLSDEKTPGESWTHNPQRETHTHTETRFQDTDYWFITTPVSRNNKTQLMYVDVEARITVCRVDKSCYFQVYIYNGNGKLHIPKKAKPAMKRYLLDNFKLTYNITAALNRKENKTFKIHYNGSEVIFGIRARGVSGDLYGMKLYYYYCEETIHESGLKLVETISPLAEPKEVALNCTGNSSPANNGTNLRAFCQWNGTWSVDNNTECLCRKGFEHSEGCTRCLNDYYKNERSNNPCKKCPRHNRNDRTNTFCRCSESYYYRLPDEIENVAARCYGLPSEVKDLTVKKNSSGFVILEWSPPSYTGGLDKVLYDIKCFSCEDLNCVNKTACSDAIYKPAKNDSKDTSVIITGLKPANYVFQVYSKNSVSRAENQKDWAVEEKRFELKPVPDSGASEVINKTRYVIFGAIGLAVILILLVTLVCVLKSRHKKQTGSQMTLNEYGMVLPTLGQKMYVDPSNYEDPEYALKEFANEINPSSLSLERVIGGGEFGDVYKGTLTMKDDTVILVAAKTLKNGCTEKSRTDFFLEASAMGQFDDPNVIHLEGVITRVAPKMIITEFMANGSLDNFLKKNDGNLTVLQMIGIGRGVASGMKYLASINFVHRDLAARNILINETMVCKVADFGLSRELETEDSSRGEYCTTGGRIPVRWTAPEAIKYRKFSTASDVWSYGILLWEIMTFGERPYWDWDNFKVMERVDQGYRMPLPLNCPADVHELMLECWDRDRGQRPTFEDIVKIIDEWIRSPETVHDEKLQYRRSRVLAAVESSTSVKEWLDTIKMSSYMPHFTEAGFKELADVAGLLDNDLKSMGITLVGHRNKMLRTIRSLPITDPSTFNQQRSKPLKH